MVGEWVAFGAPTQCLICALGGVPPVNHSKHGADGVGAGGQRLAE